MSIYFNPFLSHGKFRRGSVSSLERVLIAASIGDGPVNKPKSAASGSSKRTATSKRSQPCEPVIEQPEAECYYEENAQEIDENNKAERLETDGDSNDTSKADEESKTTLNKNLEVNAADHTQTTENKSHAVKKSAKLGRFIVKYGTHRF